LTVPKTGPTRKKAVQTGFSPHTQLRDFSDHEGQVTTDQDSAVRITIPKNANGKGYVCYAPNRPIAPFPVKGHATTQDYEGASDLDIRLALEGQRVQVCRIFACANTEVTARLFFDNAHWTGATNIELDAEDPTGKKVAGRQFDRGTARGAAIQFRASATGFHGFFVTGGNTPPQNRAPSYKLSVTYTAPQTM
jgi:alpha-amylase